MGKSKHSNTRQRQKKKPAQRDKTVEDKKKERIQEVPSNCWTTLVTLTVGIFCLITAGLVYAYATSPISSIVITDSHDTTKSKWNQHFNSNLQKGKKLFSELVGAESIAVDEQENWYTGVADGRLIKISDVGKPSENVRDITSEVDYSAGGERSAKRPLGMRIFRGKLYLADSYQGIFAIDLTSLSWEKIVGFDEVSPPLKFANDLTISKDGVIYFTDACGRWTYEHTLYSATEGRCTARVFKVNLNGENLQLVRDNLCLANGIELTRDETRLLVSEVGRRRISVLDTSSGDTIKTILLHGGGDNIRRSPNGGYWVPIPAQSHPLEKLLNRFPFIRDILMKFLRLSDIDKIVGVHKGEIVKLNEELEIVEIHQDPDGKVAWAVTEVQEYEPGRFLLGSFIAPGIVKLDKDMLHETSN